jgi:hypothetical protein
MAHLQVLLDAALADGDPEASALDPQAVYRVMLVWDRESRVTLAVEYQGAQAVTTALAFQEAWRFLRGQFANVGSDDAVGVSDEP